MEVLERYYVSTGLFSNEVKRKSDLLNLATGFIAPPETSVDKAHEVGVLILNKMYSSDNLKSFTIPKKLLAVQIPPATTTHSSSTEAMSIGRNADPQLLLQGLLSMLEDGKYPSLTLDETLRHYELSSLAPSLFAENGSMRTARKSDLAKALVKNNSLMSKENGKAVLVDPAVDVTFDGGDSTE